MKRLVMRYPEDPPCEVLVLSRAEFLERYPRQPITAVDLDTWESEILAEVPGDCICCDFCNEDPGEVIHVVRDYRAYCLPCAKRWVLPYCKES